MKKIGIISYNIYGNFTNYGSVLQSWALYTAIRRLGQGRYEPVLVDYCPDILLDADPLNPFKKMWDKDEESRRMCERSMPAIRENYDKFDRFYHERFHKTEKKYTSANFNEIISDEQIDGFVCGGDTIFCILEFHGFDDGYFANYDCMKNGYAVSYAASFGDAVFDEGTFPILNDRLQNFKALGLRENTLIDYVKEHVSVPVKKVVDPTLLLTSEDYDSIASERIIPKKYLLLYSRRYNPDMTEFAEKLAEKNGWKIIDISLRAENAELGHQMFYEAGVEEFLSLVKYAEYVVTNSFHGMIFSVQYRRPFVVFSREQCDTKIEEVLGLFGLSERLLVNGTETFGDTIDYDTVHHRINAARQESIRFLKSELDACPVKGH